jgi:hypothetical protein
MLLLVLGEPSGRPAARQVWTAMDLSHLEARQGRAAGKKRIPADCKIRAWQDPVCHVLDEAVEQRITNGQPPFNHIGYDRRTYRRCLELPAGDTEVILEMRDERVELVAVGKLVEDAVDRDCEPLFVCL